MHNTSKTNTPIALNIQGNVARLLAKENITIHRSANYRTATFDVQNRVMQVPIYKVASKEVYDLFIGHEIGHALWTTKKNIKDFTEQIGNKHTLYNVLEDIRIERLVQREYPGLIRLFKAGYKFLYENNFFGDISSLSLIDKINIKAKLGSLVDVETLDKERELIDLALSINSHEELITVAKKLVEHTSKKQEEQHVKEDQSTSSGKTSDETQPQDEDSNNESNEDSNTSENGSNENSDEPIEEPTDEESSSAEQDTNKPEENISENIEADDDSYNAGQIPEPAENDIDELKSNIQETLDEKLKANVDEDSDIVEVMAPNKEAIENSIINYSRIQEMRQQAGTHSSINLEYCNQYRKDIKKIAGHLRSEFERKKAANEYIHGKTSQRGRIDVDALHRFRFDDNIFQTVTEMPQSKSHGIFLLLDFSGSMNPSLPQVIKQALVLAEFCHMTNIPFEVYSFTSNAFSKFKHKTHSLLPNQISLDPLCMLQLLSSKMKKKEYIDATNHMINSVRNGYYISTIGVDAMGGTPLNEALIASTYLLKKFNAEHGIQIPSFFLLTDGEAHCLQIHTNTTSICRHPKQFAKILNKKHIELNWKNSTEALLLNLKNVTNANTLWFYLVKLSREINRQGWILNINEKKLSTALRKNHIFIADKTRGADKYYIMKNENEIDKELIDTTSESTIQRTFMKKQKSGKQNKVFVREVVDSIAKLI